MPEDSGVEDGRPMNTTTHAGSPTRSVLSNCRFCMPRCGVVVTVDDDERVIGVAGDRTHPRTQGYMCPKGSQIPWSHHRPDRLNHPTARGEAMDWHAVLDDLAATIKSAQEREGPEGFGIYISTGCDILGASVAFALAGALRTPQLYTAATVDVAPSYKAAEIVTGSFGLIPHWEQDDEAVRLMLLFGSNTVVSHGYAGAAGLSNAASRMHRFRSRGGKIWVFDPVCTRTAKRADEHVAPIPGTDPAILAWLVREVLARLPDDSPVRAKTKPDALTRLGAALDAFRLEAVAAVSGVEPTVLQRLLADILAAGRIVFPAGTGMSFGPHGLVGEWLRWALLVVTDSLEEPGGMWFDPGWVYKLDELPQWSPAPETGPDVSAPRSRPELLRFFGQTPCAALNDEIERGPLRVLLVFGGNPVTSTPQPDRTSLALRSLDALAVMDVVPSEMTELASHILPCTGPLERLEISGTLVSPYQPTLSPPVVKPVAERKHSWWILGQLAKRLGVWDTMFPGVDIDVATEEDIARCFVANARHTLEELTAAGPHGVTYQTCKRWAREQAVPDATWRIAPPALLARLPTLLSSAHDPAHPLILICGRQERRHNRASNLATTERSELPLLRIGSTDASIHGLREGDFAVVRSRHGAVTAQVTVDPDIRAGVVQLPHAWPDTNVQHLFTSDVVDPLTTQPQLSAMAVSIEAAPSASTGT